MMPTTYLRYRTRGRPKQSCQSGPTPQLLAKKLYSQTQWNLSQPNDITKGWWHLFYVHRHITHPDFILSQDFATLRYWARQINQQHKSWRCPLKGQEDSIRRTWEQEDDTIISKWWHDLQKEALLRDLWRDITYLYDKPIPSTYSPDLYNQLLIRGQYCLIKIATHWKSRWDFIYWRDNMGWI